MCSLHCDSFLPLVTSGVSVGQVKFQFELHWIKPMHCQYAKLPPSPNFTAVKLKLSQNFYDDHHFLENHNQSANPPTHCFFLVDEISVLCFCTTFFNSSANSSLHRSSACRRALSTSRCACASARDSAFCLSSSKSLRNCTRHSNKMSNMTGSTEQKQQS